MSDRSLKIRVGALVIVALGILVVFVVLLGGFSVGKKQTFHLEFTDSGSLLAGAPVKIAGVRAGRVSSVEFLVGRAERQSARRREREAPVNVRATIKVDATMARAIRTDSEFFITTQGVLGEKYIEIVPGSEDASTWDDDAFIRGTDPPRIDLLFARIDGILEQVEAAMGGEDLNIGEFIRSATRVTQRIDKYFEKHEARLDNVMINIDGAVADARGLMAGLKTGIGDGTEVQAIIGDARRISGALAADIKPMTRAAKKALGQAEAMMGRVSGVVQRNEQAIDQTLAGLPAIVGSVQETGRDAAYVMRRLKGGKGTIGQLLVDQEIYDDLKEMLRNLKRHPWKMLWRE